MKTLAFLLVVCSSYVYANEVCNGPHCVNYKNRSAIAPNSVPTLVGVNVNQTGYDSCCRKVVNSHGVMVEVCSPSCSLKNSVKYSKDGSRVVLDYGRYETVVKGKDGEVDVRYRRRLLNR